MPLSEEELRLLEQMERALAAEDPRFVSALEGRHLVRAARLRMTLAALVFLLGAAAVGVAMWQRMIWVGVAGFIVMVVASSWGLVEWRSHRMVARLGAVEPVEDEQHEGLRLIQGGRAERPRDRMHGHPSMGSRSRMGRGYAAWLDRLEARWLRRRDQRF